MFAPGIPQVMSDFHSNSITLASFVVSVFLIGYVAGPLFVAPISEMYGRTYVYNVSNLLFVIFTVACAVSSSLNMLIGFRFLSGACGATPLVLGGGTIADMFPQERRGGVMAVWAMGPLLGMSEVYNEYDPQAKFCRSCHWAHCRRVHVSSCLKIIARAVLILSQCRNYWVALDLLGPGDRCRSLLVHRPCYYTRDIRTSPPRTKSQEASQRDR